MLEDPYENLANAIIVQAAKDYQKALRQLRRNPKYTAAAYTKQEVERFFHSQWFQMLTDTDGRMILENLKKEVA